MSSVTIYDSEGYTYSNHQSDVDGDSRIRDFFFAGVRLSLDLSHGVEIIAFFRARESQTGRTEQYYAQYHAQTFDHRTLREFKQAVQDRASELGLTLDTSSNDVQVFRELDADHGSPPGDSFERDLVEQLLQQRQRIKIGVGSYTHALALLETLDLTNARQIAIVDDAQQDIVSDYDLTIEQGHHQGIEPLGPTQARFDEVRTEYEDTYIKQKLNAIKAEVADIQEHTSVSQNELERRLERSLPVLSSSSSNAHSSPKTSSLDTGDSSRLGSQSLSERLLDRITPKIIVVLISLLLVATAATGILYLTVFTDGGSSIDGFISGGGNSTASPTDTANASTNTSVTSTDSVTGLQKTVSTASSEGHFV